MKVSNAINSFRQQKVKVVEEARQTADELLTGMHKDVHHADMAVHRSRGQQQRRLVEKLSAKGASVAGLI